jgi:hypothetical protein
MNYAKFLGYQFILVTGILVVNTYADRYISHPFTRVDLIAILISLPLFVLLVSLISLLYRRFNSIRLRNRILLTIAAFILAVVSIALMENIWFELYGEMLF